MNLKSVLELHCATPVQTCTCFIDSNSTIYKIQSATVSHTIALPFLVETLVNDKILFLYLDILDRRKARVRLAKPVLS